MPKVCPEMVWAPRLCSRSEKHVWGPHIVLTFIAQSRPPDRYRTQFLLILCLSSCTWGWTTTTVNLGNNVDAIWKPRVFTNFIRFVRIHRGGSGGRRSTHDANRSTTGPKSSHMHSNRFNVESLCININWFSAGFESVRGKVRPPV